MEWFIGNQYIIVLIPTEMSDNVKVHFREHGILSCALMHHNLFQGFYRRRMLMARPLLKEYGIASIILENPYCILVMAGKKNNNANNISIY